MNRLTVQSISKIKLKAEDAGRDATGAMQGFWRPP